MKYRISLLFPFLLLLLHSSLSAQAECSSSPVSPAEMVKRMGRGINIGNTMEAAQEGNWQDPMEECYFDEYVRQGFQNVRIPIRWDGHTATAAPYTIDASWLDRVEEVIDWGLSKGLVVIINAHHEHWLLDDHSPTNITRFEAIWAQVADHFQHKSENLLFEIINEPYFQLTGTQVDDLNQNILNVIRVNNQSRIVLMTGGEGTSNEAPLNMAIPNDDFIMAYFHYYQPFSFTSGAVNNWGTEIEKEAIVADFDEVEDWAEANNIEVLFGEFGVDNTVDANDRAAYYRYLSLLALNRGFAFSVWEVGTTTKGFYQRNCPGTWTTDVLNGLQSEAGWNNLAGNKGFEDGISFGWSLQTGGGAAATANLEENNTHVFEGTRALRINVSTAGTAGSHVKSTSSEVPAQSLKSYVFGANVKGDATAGNHNIRLATNWTKGDGSISNNARTYSITTDYQLVGGVQTKPAIENVSGVKLSLQCGLGTGNYYFDDVHIIETDDFLNLDFEDGINYVWVTNVSNGAIASTSNTPDAQSGANALQINVATIVNSPEVTDVTVKNPIRKVPDSEIGYKYSFYAKGPSGSSLSFMVHYYDNAENLITTGSYDEDLSTTYSNFFRSFSLPLNTAYFEISFNVGETVGSYFIDEVTIDCIESPFPVELVSFDAVAEGNNAVLDWVTTNEVDNDQFEIERSEDGVRFHRLGSIPATNSSQLGDSYTYTDFDIKTLESPVLYYRLKQIDISDHFEYSPIRSVQRPSQDNEEISLYPNPVAGQLFIQTAEILGDVFIRITNSNGQIIGQQPQKESNSSWKVNTHDLPNGVYNLQLQIHGDWMVKRFIVIQ